TTEQTTNFKVKILFKETGVEIRPGMSATVDIITNTRTDALTVPYGAIVMRPPATDSLKVGAKDSSGIQAISTESTAGETPDKKTKDQKGVFVIKDSKAKFISVETGIADQKNIEITSGVTAKDSVITGPFKTLRMLKDGEGIKVEKQFKIGVSN
ncbi:MAG: hypothetical protein NTV06_08850, partial [candidate division Zixibacteria bacterium]|nr:hypothetical protein [candidate division Zixibacteria bacterium]